MTTVAELLRSDFKEDYARMKRYWQSSSLPIIEKRKRKTVPPKSPRDRVLMQIVRMDRLADGRKFIQG